MLNVFWQLYQPFPVDEVQWRVGKVSKDKPSGMALAYVDGRTIMDRLDTVVGPMNWSTKFITHDKGILCELSLCIGGQWVTKTDGADNTDIEAVKGGISSALKRAAVSWGMGRYLYDLPTIWVELEPSKKFITDAGKQAASSKLEDWTKKWSALTPYLTVKEMERLQVRHNELGGPKVEEVFGTATINTQAAKNYLALLEVLPKCDPFQKEQETFKCLLASYKRHPYNPQVFA